LLTNYHQTNVCSLQPTSSSAVSCPKCR
jgi:hypothetical protein